VLADDEEFEPLLAAKPGEPSSEQRHQPNKKLHQLDESHDHLFSSSFLNSLSGEVVDASSSAHLNDVLFDLDFGDPDVGLGEEMERDLEEAWNMKVNGQDASPPAAGNFNFERLSCVHLYAYMNASALISIYTTASPAVLEIWVTEAWTFLMTHSALGWDLVLRSRTRLILLRIAR
jgi:hypothetical protein